MNVFEALYTRLLSVGFLVMREAVESGDRAWIDAELEMLHNLPSLIGESNWARHKYYWNSERAHYIEWINSAGSERAKSRMRTYYEPVWNEMEGHFSEHAPAAASGSAATQSGGRWT